MNEKVLNVLEYNKIIKMLEDKATSPLGKELALSLKPGCDLEKINRAQEETAAAFSRIISRGSTSFGSNKDIGFSLKSLEIGSTLSVPELLKIAAFLENTARIKTYGKKEKDSDKEDILSPYFEEGQAPLSMGFSRQEYWSGSPFPTPGDLPNPGIEPVSPALAGRFFTTEAPGKPI